MTSSRGFNWLGDVYDSGCGGSAWLTSTAVSSKNITLYYLKCTSCGYQGADAGKTDTTDRLSCRHANTKTKLVCSKSSGGTSSSYNF